MQIYVFSNNWFSVETFCIGLQNVLIIYQDCSYHFSFEGWYFGDIWFYLKYTAVSNMAGGTNQSLNFSTVPCVLLHFCPLETYMPNCKVILFYHCWHFNERIKQSMYSFLQILCAYPYVTNPQVWVTCNLNIQVLL
jgi:hypothetical protein